MAYVLFDDFDLGLLGDSDKVSFRGHSLWSFMVTVTWVPLGDSDIGLHCPGSLSILLAVFVQC